MITSANLDLLLQSMLSQLPLARLAQLSAPEITPDACPADLASLAIEASRLVAASKRTTGSDAEIESAAAQLCVRAESLIVRPVEQNQRMLQASLFVLEAFVFSLKAVATCVAASVTVETA